MARRAFPDDQLAYSLRSNDLTLRGVPATTAVVYSDAVATTLADISLTSGGASISGSTLTLDAYSRIPIFYGPTSGTDTLYVVVNDGPATAIYARVDDRIDAEVADRATADALLIPLAQKGAAGGVATLDGSATVPDAQIPATIARDTEITTALAALTAKLPINVLSYIVGDGVTNDGAQYQAAMTAAAAAGRALYHPGGVTAYLGSTTLSVPSNAVWFGDGYTSLLTSDRAGTYAFAKNTGWSTSTAASHIRISGLRCRRPVVLAGNEGPYDAAILMRKVDDVYVDDVWCEGSMSGVEFEGCTNYGWDRIRGYRNGDVTLRINWYDGNDPAGGTQAGWAYSRDAGYQLLDGSALPQPSGPVGSAFLCTQSDVSMGRLICVDARKQALEIGAVVRNLDIECLTAVVNTAGRSGTALLANYSGVHIGKYVLRLNAAGTGGLSATGDGVSQVQQKLVIDEIVGWDLNNDTTARALLSLGRDVDRVKVGTVTAYGMQAFAVGGGGTPLLGTVDVDVDSIYVNGAPGIGVSVAGATAPGASGPYRFGRIHAVNCGRDTTISDPKSRAGVEFQGSGITITVDSLRAEDTRTGASRTQTYGVYNSNATVSIGDIELTNNLTGPYTSDGANHLVARFRGTGSPESAVTASPGSKYVRTDGGVGTSEYTKQTGDGTTGWRPTVLPAPTTIIATNASWPIPAGATTLRITTVAGGGSGGGAGSAAAAQLESGGGGGGAGGDSTQVVSVGANTTLAVTIGAGGTAPNGGAAGGNAGTAGNAGNTTSVTGTGISVAALGGSGGNASSASSTGGVSGGVKGAAAGGAKGSFGPGSGGQATGVSTGGSPGGYSGGGGGAGGSATATLGGGGGVAGTAIAGGGTGSQGGTSAGVDGADAAANTGAGGGGGGGGAAGTGAGGRGGAGGSGFVVIEVLA